MLGTGAKMKRLPKEQALNDIIMLYSPKYLRGGNHALHFAIGMLI